MKRILAGLPDEDIDWLDARAAEKGTSRASILRDAVTVYKAQTHVSAENDWLKAGFGAWAHRTDIGDAVEWQRRERASWTRAWDDDYEAVKAEFPDLFDAENDRQRQIYLDMVAGKHPESNPPKFV